MEAGKQAVIIAVPKRGGGYRMPEIPVTSFAHRTLRNLSRYRSCDEKTAQPGCDLRGLQLHGDERLIGVYENVPGSTESCVAFTQSGIYVHRRTGWESIKFKDMVGFHFESSPTVDSLLIECAGGGLAQVPILGGDLTTGARDVAIVTQF